MDFTDRTTSVLFGDGAGAVVIEPTDGEHGLLATDLGLDGSVYHILETPVDGTMGDRVQPDPAVSGLSMEGQEVFRRAVTKMSESSLKSLESAGVSLDEIDLLIPHQANVRIIDATARRLGLDESKVYVNIHSYGNTSAATIPVALTEALEEGRIHPGDTIVFAAFGAGLSWGSAVYRWGSRVEPIAESDAALPPPDRDTMELLQPNFDFFGLPEKLS
jgi:3-oxoacyl-[acyl-carrier-protein] synthase-3